MIVATGATPYRPPLELDDALPVFESWDVIKSNAAELPKDESWWPTGAATGSVWGSRR